MLESLAEGLAAHRGAPDKVPARRLATLEAAGELAIPFTTGILVGIGDDRPGQLAALRAIAASHARHGHVQEVIVQNFLPKPGHGDGAGGAVPARGPAVGDRGGPPRAPARDPRAGAAEPLRRPGTRCSHAGIDDWGGVSPVTADHVNPERAWPALEVLREATEAAGHVLAPRLTVYPTFALDPERWLDPALRFAVLDASDAEGLARDAPWCSGGEDAPARRCSADPGARGRGRRRPRPGRRGGRGPGRRGPRARRWARRRSSRLFSARGPEVRMVAEVADDLRRQARGRRRDLRAQPQHQLHERLHVQVPLLRVLEGAAVAQPARRPLPAGARRDHAAGRRGRGRGRDRGVPAGRHPPRLRRRLLPARARGGARRFGATSTSTASPRWR